MKYKILVVDDDKELVKMLCSYFNMKQYETITATDGMEALNKIKMKPDIILLDINLSLIHIYKFDYPIKVYIAERFSFNESPSAFSISGGDFIH